MIELKEKTLQSFLYKAIDKAASFQKQQLVSWTKEIGAVPLVGVFHRAKNSGKNRIFWMNTTNDFSIVGIGTAHHIVAEENRFEQLQKQWQELLEEAMIHDPFHDVGTGLVSLGGMSFDPDKESSGLWDKYPTSQLTIPEMMVVHHKDKWYVTMNRFVRADEKMDSLLDEIQQLEDMLQGPSMNERSFQKIVT